MKQINHDISEPPRDRSGFGLYWANFTVLTALWVGMLYAGELNWHSIALGLWTGLFIATWAIELTGNKAPRWMRR